LLPCRDPQARCASERRAEGDKLDILATLVEKYEDRSWPNIDISDPIDLLNYAIEELGHSQAELAELLGSRSRASELLNRRRPLTVEMIHKISEAWKIPADLLVRPSRVAAWARRADSGAISTVGVFGL
jgi:HTH-type transcriptional regulator/antitoxin HigA